VAGVNSDVAQTVFPTEISCGSPPPLPAELDEEELLDELEEEITLDELLDDETLLLDEEETTELELDTLLLDDAEPQFDVHAGASLLYNKDAPACTSNATERLFIANAYFLPGYRLLRAIKRAAKRGVKVTLVIQGQPDMPWVTMCSRLLYGYLMRAGVTIYEYCERPLHGKIAVADRRWVTVGSSNLDPLSLSLNLEANLIIDSESFNQHVHDHLQNLVEKQCKPVSITTARHGGWWRAPIIFLAFHFLRHFPAMAGWLPAHSLDIKTVKTEKA